MSDFKIGDVVQLKSGGPAMTITAVGPTTLTCEWFDQSEMPHSKVFVHNAVEIYQPPSF
ncbi:YodC family protein [Frateuria terrea]|uniref:Uncharacterized small protein n=1 Tax=Frateuria terrea TaxID=529704 RepID=A0A1H6UJP9_9GAMM|nr:DUF2158 domain-containing protein [Frateuria terrea]SEI92541.1 Uncharacterized small protein [Frateuria terrea]SFP35268.1 Uncharacterized small protein [Frateuria terrea]